MIIQNYGLFWKRAEVRWGKRGSGNSGTLIGRLANKATSKAVDFREQAGIYVLQDSFRTIYVGQAGSGTQRLFKRLRAHTRNHLSERWDRFSWFGVYPVHKGILDTKFNVANVKTDVFSILNHLEGALISVTEPPLNRQGARFPEVEQYVQMRSDAEAESDDDDPEDDPD